MKNMKKWLFLSTLDLIVTSAALLSVSGVTVSKHFRNKFFINKSVFINNAQCHRHGHHCHRHGHHCHHHCQHHCRPRSTQGRSAPHHPLPRVQVHQAPFDKNISVKYIAR